MAHQIEEDDAVFGDIDIDDADILTSAGMGKPNSSSSLQDRSRGFLSHILAYKNLEQTLRIAGGGVGAFLLFSVLLDIIFLKWIFYPLLVFNLFHRGCYGVLFILAEVRWERLLKHASFLGSFTGRGILYLFAATGFSGRNILSFSWWMTAIAFGSLGLLNLIVGWAQSSSATDDDSSAV